VLIDFDGLDDLVCLPLSQSYGCSVRGRPDLNLYFGKGRRPQWGNDLRGFVEALDALQG
jgi:hypothetical protein